MEQLYSIEQIKNWTLHCNSNVLSEEQLIIDINDLTHENIKKANEINDPDQGTLDLPHL